MEEQEINVGMPVWFDIGREYLLPGVIKEKKIATGKSGTFLTVRNLLDAKMYSLGTQPLVQFRKHLEEDGIEDMTQLEDLHDGAVLYNLKKRFEKQMIYTYIGSILLSVNPYKMYNIYGTDTVLKYKGKSFMDNPPHLFAIANVAYSKMVDAKHNQCIIISGESGSGKTEATKLILRYLAAVHHRHKDSVTHQILEATPLLESFGNAKTVRNDNSSRFGKYIEIFLQDGVICGAITSQYLLEKSRIVFQAKNERNYHIFYEMLAGLSSQQKQRFYLQEAETYYYLNQGGNCEIWGKDDGEDFLRLLSSMEVLGFSPDEQNTIFLILSSVLHLGNVYFEKYETDSQEVASVVSAHEIRVVAELLQVSPEGLQKSITYKATETMREKIFTPLTVESAVDARDAVAKILYSLIFNWLTDRINRLVSPKAETMSIAILDIYGFEDLSINSFEQLCINYANEYLQYFFNKIIFKLEQEEYIKEQIDWKQITFSDNQPCLDLISQKPYGILRILDDQSSFPQATDHTFLQKCHYHHGSNPLYSKPKMPLPEFTIKHYAGKVTYQVHKFVEKNHDQVRQDVIELFVNSKIKILTSLFMGQTMKMMSNKNSTISRRYAPTVAAKFQQSLMELVEKMESCNPFFVRCIKPNNKKEPELFEVDVVSSQLRYSGILETIRIRKEGYPVRITFDNFIKRYKILLGLTNQIKADGENCIAILKQIVPVSRGTYSIGLTKLFIKENLYHTLDSKRDGLMLMASLTLQRYARGFFARKRYTKLRRTTILLQAAARGYITRKKFKKYKQSLIKVRSVVLMFTNRRRFLRIREQNRERIEMEQTMREVVNVAHLDIPAELAALLQAAAVGKETQADCIIQTEIPKVLSEQQLSMPLDINNYPFSRFVWTHFRDHLFGMLTSPLEEALTQTEEDITHETVTVFKLILRFMGDPHLNGTQEILFGNYIAQIGLANSNLRNEIFAQIANQVWRNINDKNAERGWLLMATCLSSFAPSSKMDKYLLKFVSDHGFNGFKSVCQHKLLQAMHKAKYGPEGARGYPPSLLEWTGNKRKANIAIEVSCFDGKNFMCPVNSWTTGEELGQDLLRHRDITEGWRGWTVGRKHKGEWTELGGHDYVMDLVSDLELPTDFPRQKSFFMISSEGKTKSRKSRNVVFGHGFDSDEDIPSPPVTQAPVFVPDSERYPTGSIRRDSDAFNERRSQKGLDRYLDSLFDPVLSYENGVRKRTSLVSNRMKGGGKVGPGNGDGTQLGHQGLAKRPGAQQRYDLPQINAQQQDFINQQAYLLAQQMTMQAMALQQQMTSASPPDAMLNHNPSLNHNHSTAMKPTTSNQKSPNQKMGLPPQTNAANKDFVQPEISHHAAKGKPAVITPRASQTPKLNVATQDPVRHMMLNSGHLPEPTHNIKDIIKQYEQPAIRKQAGPIRKEGGKIFTRRTDPHEEAMSILKGQKTQYVSQKPQPAPLKKSSNETVAMVKPVGGSAMKASTRPMPAVSSRHPIFSGASISRELTGNDERIQTQLHRQPCEACYTYSNVSWNICARKEVFYPNDNFHSPVVLDLIFRQIIYDTFSETCVRLNKEQQMKMRSLLAENNIQASTLVKDEVVKRKIVTTARESWDIYFCRLFPASGSVGTGVQVLGVSHKGINLLKLVRSRSTPTENLRVLRSYSYTDILFVTIPSENMLDFNLTNEKLILFSSKAPQIKNMIDYFITELKKDSNYVVAVKSHITNDSSFLRFHKGDIICLQSSDGVEEGWKFGAFHGRSGLVPLEYVQPVAAPDFIHLSTDKKEEPKDKKGKVAASSSALVAAAVGSTAAAEELDRKTEASPPEFVDSIPEYGIQDSQYTMIEFAKKYFRKSPKFKSESNREKSKKSKDQKDLSELVKYTKTPIQESLIEFSDENMNKIAAEIFVAVMKFMGDHPFKGQTEQDVIYTILKLCGEHEVMKDETYCQIIKQITDNTSSKTDSIQRGWRVLYILTAYYKCSEVLKPYLFKLMETVCRMPGASFQGIAKACHQNLKKTFQFGGRIQFPDGIELRAMVAGRSSKRQVFLLPGNVERHLKIKTCSVAVDVIEDLCTEMGLQNPEAAEEYSVFVITNKGQNVQPLNKKDYILDVAATTEQADPNFTFCFRRILWIQPLKFENELCVTVHFNQIVADYLKGLFHVLSQEMTSDSKLQQMSKLAALQHRAKDGLYLPTTREVQDYVPVKVYQHQRPQSWLSMVTQNTQHVQALSPHQARAQFLGLVSAFPMFGSSFFYIQSSSNNAIVAPCILAVNQNGLNFLDKETHELMVSFTLKEVQSTLTERLDPTNSYPYVEIKLGDLMSQRIMQLQLDQALEMCRVTAMHVEAMLLAREKRLTLPPSEITML
ncbi:unconventional myosin-XV [Amblyraja radiata]|uniref:unconventional myosin-XV n=1 Tax=Amblyraja radiata TaxID=386614 RepID=UPI001403C4C5|nr:unconventional myosin-XV [Amblyraja radiata]